MDMNTKIAALALASTVGTACIALTQDPVKEVEAAAVGPFGHLALANGSTSSWRAAVAAANAEIHQDGSGFFGHKRVRLVFADGGWVEFEPCPKAMRKNALPPMLAMQFGQRS